MTASLIVKVRGDALATPERVTAAAADRAAARRTRRPHAPHRAPALGFVVPAAERVERLRTPDTAVVRMSRLPRRRVVAPDR